jgi:formate dehydrogenase major subunit
VPGLGASFGRGGATTFQQDLANSDCIVIMGSNAAECHPVGFQYVMDAREKGSQVIHIDPRYTRTSAMATRYMRLRAGSDIALLGGVINHILQNGLEFREYVKHYTNASVIIDDRFLDTEDLDGLFSGWDPTERRYDTRTWSYKGMEIAASAGEREQGGTIGEQADHGGQNAGLSRGEPPHEDPSLEHPRCVFQILKRHFHRYTPEKVEEITGVPASQVVWLAETLARNSGRERTSAFCYAVGWTQHTTGVQYIRAASIIQLLLGNVGRPGGGVMALRGHATIQGSTDIPTLYNILPGYIPMPHAHVDDSLKKFIEVYSGYAGFWGHMPAYFISLLKAWWGDAATPDNEFCFNRLPRISGDHSMYPIALGMRDKTVKGMICVGQNPAVGSANAGLYRRAMADLEWLVVRDFVESETAAFWYDSQEVDDGQLLTEEIGTEVFFMPAAAQTEKNGSYTNTQRLVQWHHQAVEPRGDSRSELWFYYHLGRIIREKLADSTEDRDRGVLDLTWTYPTEGELQEPNAEAILAEINGFGSDGKPVSTYTELKDDGTTSCGCWIYCGVYANGENMAARRKPWKEQSVAAPEWGWAWPANRRILYNRASADPDGRPWSERKRWVWWDEAQGKWTGEDVPDFVIDMRPDYEPPEGARAEKALRGDKPFVMQGDGRGWLFAPAGLVDGPLPVHYEPDESPIDNLVYGQRSNPVRERLPRPLNPHNPAGHEPGAERFPYVLTTYRLTEHHTGGGMSRYVEHLAELQPAMFCEVSPQLAAERGLANGGWATISTTRAAIEARVLVTDRMDPVTVDGHTVHQVGVPFHYGPRGFARGDSANDLLAMVMDPNVHIQESKAATCDIRAGRHARRPRRRGSGPGDG